MTMMLSLPSWWQSHLELRMASHIVRVSSRNSLVRPLSLCRTRDSNPNIGEE